MFTASIFTGVHNFFHSSAWKDISLGLVALVVWDPFEILGVAMPYPRTVEVTWLGQDGWTQGWPVGKAVKYHHLSQGTKILPIAWFRALEPPTINPLRGNERLAARDYLSRFGFLYDPGPAKGEDLPIGFAVVLFAGFFRRDLLHGYKPPMWMLVLGAITLVGCAWMGWSSIATLPKLWA